MDELWRDEEKRENEKKWKNGRKKRERNYCDGWSLYGLAYRLSSRVNEWTSTHSTSQSIMVATKSTSKDPRHLFFFVFVSNFLCVQSALLRLSLYIIEDEYVQWKRTHVQLSQRVTQSTRSISSQLFFVVGKKKIKVSLWNIRRTSIFLFFFVRLPAPPLLHIDFIEFPLLLFI